MRTTRTKFALTLTLITHTLFSQVPDPGRVTVAEVTTNDLRTLKVLRTPDGKPLRGPNLWQWKSSAQNNSNMDRNALLSNQSIFNEFRDAGMTVVRLASFEVWFQSDNQPYADWSWSDLSDPTEVANMLSVLESAVDAAAAAGLQIMINAHNKFVTYDHAYTQAFWEIVAPHFANRTHVIYELGNEIGEGPANYVGQMITDHVQLSRRVRQLAPDTFQVVLSPSGTWGPSDLINWTGINYDAMLDMANRFNAEWTSQSGSPDWNKTAVGYHLYFNGATSTILKNLHEVYPGIPTEVGFPYNIQGLVDVAPHDTARTEEMDGKYFVNEVCEELGLGWMQWQTETINKWRGNIRLLTKDAQAKGYYWNAEGPMLDWHLLANTQDPSERGDLYDGINLFGTLGVNISPGSILTLKFDTPGSNVNWLNPFWDNSYTGTNGWLLYDLSEGNFTGLTNFSINVGLDSLSQSLAALRPGAYFSLFQNGNDVYLQYFTNLIPEPGTYAVLLAAFALLLWLRLRRKSNPHAPQKI